MDAETRFSPLYMAGGVVAFIAGVLLLQLESTAPLSTPEKTITAFLEAASTANLQQLARTSTDGYYRELIRRHGETKLSRVTSVYQQAAQLGRQRWNHHRQRAENLAVNEYYSLRAQVENLGRDALLDLAADQRLELLADRAALDRFVLERGVASLPPDSRRRIGDPALLRQPRGFVDFVNRNGWELLSPDERTALGDPQALASPDSEKGQNFIYRTGIGMLDDAARAEIAGIQRSELRDPEAFKLKHGPAVLLAQLRAIGVPAAWVAAGPPRHQSDAFGSLIRGDVVSHHIAQSKERVRVERTVVLQKVEFEWRVAQVRGQEIDAPMR